MAIEAKRPKFGYMLSQSALCRIHHLAEDSFPFLEVKSDLMGTKNFTDARLHPSRNGRMSHLDEGNRKNHITR